MALLVQYHNRTSRLGEAALELIVFVALAALLAGVATSVYARVINYTEDQQIHQSAIALDHQALYTAALYSVGDSGVDPGTGRLFVIESSGAIQGGKLSISVGGSPGEYTVRSEPSGRAVCLITSGQLLVPGTVVAGNCPA
jgi:hypothetical protein